MILDTNVLSEPTKPYADESVVRWIDQHDVSSLHLTSISLAELLFGIETLPHGRRRNKVKRVLDDLLERCIGDRILPFDSDAALQFSIRTARARRRGLTIAIADGQIASIAAVHGFPVATRDEEPFKIMGVKVINPWKLR